MDGSSVMCLINVQREHQQAGQVGTPVIQQNSVTLLW